MDRSKTDIASCQSGFISILIKPFFDEWTQVGLHWTPRLGTPRRTSHQTPRRTPIGPHAAPPSDPTPHLMKPCIDEWTQFLGDDQRHIFSNIEDNIKKWTEGGEAALEQALNDAKRFERLKKGNA
jgi:hypothetical protein